MCESGGGCTVYCFFNTPGIVNIDNVYRKRINDAFDAILYKLLNFTGIGMQTHHPKKRSLPSSPSKHIKRVHDRLSIKIGDLVQRPTF